MNRVKLFNTPDINWVLEDKNCIELYALNGFTIHQNEVKMIHFNDFSYEFEDAVGVPYIPKDLNHLTIYYPFGLSLWKDNGNAKLGVRNLTDSEILIHKGDHIANINLMSIQFFKLMRKGNNSDRGLRSCRIKIEF